MSADHKRPLYAFVIVAVLCALIIGNQLRSEAADIRKAIEAGAARVIPGMALHHVQQVHPTEPPLLQSTEPAAPRTTEAAAPTAPPAPAAMPSSPEPVSGATGHAQPVGQGTTGPSVTHSATHSVTHTVKHSAGSVIVHQEARQLVHTIARAAHVARPPVSGLVHQVRRQLARPGAGVRPGHGHGLALGLLRGRHEAPGHLQSHHRGDARGHHGHAHGHGPR